MPAALTDKLHKVGASTVTTLAAPGKALAAASINVGSTTNYPTDTGIVIAIRQVDTDGELVAGTYTEWNATVSSATSLAISTTPRYGSDQVYPAGSTTQVFIVVSAAAHNDLVDALLAEHKQDGSHGDVDADTVDATSGTFTNLTATNGTFTSLTVGSQTPTADWTALGSAPNTVTHNGNRSYSLVFNSVDYSGTINPGTKLRTTRTVAASNQCASLNGSTQYFNDTSVSGITFTDDFVAGAWIKLNSYGSQYDIISRKTTTNGWKLSVNTDGTLRLIGYNGSGSNSSQVSSVQSIPLNKWVHVAAQLDMSAFTATSTTSYVMFDGVDVPATVSRGGTNPTALVQAGNLEVGSSDGGSNPFSGKISNVFVSSAKIPQANVQILMTRTLTAADTSTYSLASAYTLSNSLADLNTTNANDLTAQGSAATTNADSPFGAQANGTISTTLDYGIVQSCTFSTNTTVVVQVPEGNTIPASGGVSAVSYSSAKAPYGMPIDKYKHSLEFVYRSQISQVVTSNTAWLNISGVSFNLPIGKYDVQANVNTGLTSNSTTYVGVRLTISNANNTNAMPYLSSASPLSSTASTQANGSVKLEGPLDVSTQATYYVNAQPVTVSGTTTAYIFGSDAPALFRFFNAYL